ncbi:MAG: aminotransferase class I/II-fold pyridoxal phosphate-dependent enzyme [Alphaproteobacteria bacterium]|nr:aminotransferase class I/II-fold pyridoxal phosphate-dependent enzyme [Alphaproteobacteria bacterium]
MAKKTEAPGFSTLAIHAGARPDPVTGAAVTPVYQTASYAIENLDKATALFAWADLEGFNYTRCGNPTTRVLEERITALEGGLAAVAVASGQSATMLIIDALLGPGDELIAVPNVFGGSYALFTGIFTKYGIKVKWANPADAASFAAQISPKTKAIFLESLSNPDNLVADFEGIAKLAKQHHIPFIVDNTMASPYLCQPFKHGADIVIHSCTKYLNGHGNSIGGIIIDSGHFDWAKDDRFPALGKPHPRKGTPPLIDTYGKKALAVLLRQNLTVQGPALAPMNAFLTITGIETLPLRMDRHVSNAMKVALYLQKHPAIASVKYAGLPDSPEKERVAKYLPRGTGAILLADLKGGRPAAAKLIERLKLFTHLANIGETRSLIVYPDTTTHRQLNEQEKALVSVGPGTLRLSIGLEDADDILTDLAQALDFLSDVGAA